MTEKSHSTAPDNAARLLEQAQSNRHVKGHKFFFGYLHGRLKRTPLYVQWQELLTSFRRIRLLARLVGVLGFLFSAVETGTVVILSTALLLVILPVLLLLMAGILLTAQLKSRRSNRELDCLLADRTVVIAFMADPPGGFQEQSLRDLAARGYAVVLVAPHWISPRGLVKSPFYLTFRQETEHLYLVRPYYFFSLRKNVLSTKRLVWTF